MTGPVINAAVVTRVGGWGHEPRTLSTRKSIPRASCRTLSKQAQSHAPSPLLIPNLTLSQSKTRCCQHESTKYSVSTVTRVALNLCICIYLYKFQTNRACPMSIVLSNSWNDPSFWLDIKSYFWTRLYATGYFWIETSRLIRLSIDWWFHINNNNNQHAMSKPII